MNKERVLVVDDEQLNLFIIEEFLAQEDIELEMHSNPLEAWASLSAPDSDFSLVVLDRMMPELDGMELLRRMKREARFADIPVIMQTAASSPDQVREGLEAGAYYYLTKPYEPEALISIVRAALEDRRGRSQLRSRAARLEEAQALIQSVNTFVTEKIFDA
jgi:DNA-binding response OmpR family regulator